MYGAGSAKWNTAVSGSGVSIDSTERNVLIPRGCDFFRTSRMLNLTSALENGWPSWNLTPSCRLNVIVFPSGLTVHDFANPGIGFRLKSYSSKPSYTFVVTCPIGPEVLAYAASVGGSGCTTITSVPPRWGCAPPCAEAGCGDENATSASMATIVRSAQTRRAIIPPGQVDARAAAARAGPMIVQRATKSGPGRPTPGSLLDEIARDDVALDFRRALEDAEDPAVANVALERQAARVAIAAVNLKCEVRHAIDHLGGEKLGHGRLLRIALAAPPPRRCGKAQRASGGNVGRHVGEHPLHALILGNRHAADVPFARPANRRRERRFGDADRAGGDLDSTGIEHLERRAKTRSFRPDPIRRRHDTVERHLEHVRRAKSHRVLGGRDAHALLPWIDDECGDAACPRRAIGLREHDDEPRFARVRDEVLGAAQPVAVAFVHRDRRHVGGIRAGARLG